MTITLRPTPQELELLQHEAQRVGQPVEEFAKNALMEVIEDVRDSVEARQILASTNSAEWRTLDDLRKAVRG